jgi:transcriptional regulator with XRE-family HTH domain
MKVAQQADNWFRRRRGRLHLTQAQMAKRCGVHRRAIWSWECNTTSPSVTKIPALAAGYAVDEPAELNLRAIDARPGVHIQAVGNVAGDDAGVDRRRVATDRADKLKSARSTRLSCAPSSGIFGFGDDDRWAVERRG